MALGCTSSSGTTTTGTGGGSGGSATGGSGTGGTATGGSASGGNTATGGSGTGGAATGGAGGKATGGSGTGGSATGGSGTGGTATGGAGGGGGLVWPNATSFTNSDLWISQHHDQITQMNPNVLVLNYANKCGANDAKTCDPTYVQTLISEHVKAFQWASRYHGYNDANAPAFINYNVIKIVDLRDSSGNTNSAQVPIATNEDVINYASLNTQAYADLIGIQDPANPGTNLTLCQLFEKGIINEVWGSVADPAPNGPMGSAVKFGESAESKMVYDANNVPVSPTKFITVGNGPDISPNSRDANTKLTCKVTTRIWDFNPTRGSGCHLHSLGHLYENYVRNGALPALNKVALTFFNLDFRTRFGASFNSFYDVCPYTNDICIAWQANGSMPDIEAKSGTSSSQTFDFADMSAGCGNVHFPANATTQYETTGDVNVSTSCENYGLHNGTGGKDLTTPYTNAMIATKYGETRQDNGFDNFANGVASDCGAVQPTYIFGSMPGLGNTATASDGTPMHNWWVYLFY
ncbi:MAG TPA: hypothetical protein VKZ18_13220 [Polyangia bacterium]|nr:hypothetical protein [Polyangia bacterium]